MTPKRSGLVVENDQYAAFVRRVIVAYSRRVTAGGFANTAAVLAVCAAVFPDERVPDRTRLILEDLFGES